MSIRLFCLLFVLTQTIVAEELVEQSDSLNNDSNLLENPIQAPSSFKKILMVTGSSFSFAGWLLYYALLKDRTKPTNTHPLPVRQSKDPLENLKESKLQEKEADQMQDHVKKELPYRLSYSSLKKWNDTSFLYF